MPVLELTDEELQGFVHLCATASGPGVSWMLTNALLTKARLAQEASGVVSTPQPHLNSKGAGDAAVPRP